MSVCTFHGIFYHLPDLQNAGGEDTKGAFEKFEKEGVVNMPAVQQYRKVYATVTIKTEILVPEVWTDEQVWNHLDEMFPDAAEIVWSDEKYIK